MRICVYGLWHLGCVTAACLAEAGLSTIGLDLQREVVAILSQGRPPLHEPGLEALIRDNQRAGRLDFTNDPLCASTADIVWVTFDTPVDDADRADDEFVKRAVERLFPHLRDGSVVLISSQLPVGTTHALEQSFTQVAAGRTVGFAYSPENLRLGRAIEAFTRPERIVVGIREARVRAVLEPVLARFTRSILWVSVESAEMTKHALNAFLATSVTFMNEVATVCEHVGADAAEVEQALRSEPRIGQRAYIRPGGAFAGGTLARDVVFLTQLGVRHDLTLPLLDGIIPSNEHHRQWPFNQLSARLRELAGRRITVLGLTYTPGTSSLRRSPGFALCRQLVAAGAIVAAHDPAADVLPADMAANVERATSAMTALHQADAAVIATEWPEYRGLTPQDLVPVMAGRLILDPGRFIAEQFAHAAGWQYVTVGTPL